MLHMILRSMLRVERDEKGVVLILTALLIVPFIVLLGVAVDVGRLLVVKNQLATAVDAAAIALAKNPSLTDQTKEQTLVNAFEAADIPSQTGVSFSTPTVQRSNNNLTVDVWVTATINTNFVGIIGYNTLQTTVHSQAVAAQNHLEVVLVLDNTGSMGSMYGSTTGIVGLQNAATTLVNTLFAADPNKQYVKIGVVPFTDAVNVGTQYATAAWIDNSNNAGSMSQENISAPTGTGLITFASSLATATNQSSWTWGGCVRQRTEMVNSVRVDYDITDVAPNASNPATLYTPFFAPDEPDANQQNVSHGGKTSYSDSCYGNSSFFNSYLCDNSCWKSSSSLSDSNYAADQQCVAKYTSSPQASGNGGGPNNLCTIQPIIPLTNDQSAITAEINAMQAYGATVIPAGLTWGWHLLSPIVAPVLFPSNTSPALYTDSTTIKAIILVTDGFNDVQLSAGNGVPASTSNGFNQSIFNAYGYGSGPHLSLLSVPSGTSEDQPDYNLDQKLLALCANIKAVQDASGNPGRIVLYAIGFGSSINNHGLGLLQQCATSTSTYFYNPTGDELNTTFQNIALGLNKLRLSQ